VGSPKVKLLWCTDLHLNFLRYADGPLEFAKSLDQDADGLIITGDISDGFGLEIHLRQLAEGFPKPIYFVLGNHDFYYSSFGVIDQMVIDLTKEVDNLFCLNHGSHKIDDAYIVGVGGWYDAYHGDQNSKVQLADWELIKELRAGKNNRRILLSLIRDRAALEADILDAQLKEGCNLSDNIIVCTHVPPYSEAAWHEGKPSDRIWVPWFSSGSLGRVLDNNARINPTKTFLVLTGHSHSPGIYCRDNVTVYTGGAKYGFPDLNGVLNLSDRNIVAADFAGIVLERQY